MPEKEFAFGDVIYVPGFDFMDGYKTHQHIERACVIAGWRRSDGVLAVLPMTSALCHCNLFNDYLGKQRPCNNPLGHARKGLDFKLRDWPRPSLVRADRVYWVSPSSPVRCVGALSLRDCIALCDMLEALHQDYPFED